MMKILRGLTVVLWVVALVSGAVLLVTMIRPESVASGTLSLSDRPQADDPVFVEEARQISFEAHEQVFVARDIFESFWNVASSAGGAGWPVLPLDTGLSEAELDSRYKVVGIVIDAHPQAVIQDRATQNTVSLSVGQTLENAVIRAIAPGEVRLFLNGEIVSLRL